MRTLAELKRDEIIGILYEIGDDEDLPDPSVINRIKNKYGVECLNLLLNIVVKIEKGQIRLENLFDVALIEKDDGTRMIEVRKFGDASPYMS